MTKVPMAPYAGPLTIDMTSLGGLLVDLPKGATHHLRPEKPGCDGVVLELANNVPTSGAAAGIPENVYARFVAQTDAINQLRRARVEVAKLLEVMVESEAKYVDERENDISIMVDAIRSVAKRTGDKALQAPFEKMLRYYSQIGDKAAKTRRKKVAAGGDDEPEGG